MSDVAVEQSGGKNSTNIQNNDMSTNSLTVINQGMTYNDTKQMLLDLMSEEEKKYKGIALQVMDERLQDFSNEFLEKLYAKEGDQGLEKLGIPSMQHSVYNAQKGYCLDEKGDLKSTYVDMLLSRMETTEKNALQISIDEAIKTVECLTNEQMDTLTMIFLIFYHIKPIRNLIELKEHIDLICSFYHNDQNLENTCISLKVYKSCLSLEEAKHYKPIEEIYKNAFSGLFFKGFDIEELTNISGNDINFYRKIVVRDLRNPQKFQLGVMDLSTLKSQIVGTNMEKEESQLTQLFNNHIMTIDEVKNELINMNPIIGSLLEQWKNSDLKYMQLTPIGRIIAIANYNRKCDNKLRYSDFIN